MSAAPKKKAAPKKPAAHPTYKEMVGTAIKELSDPRVTQLLRGADAQR